MGMTADRRSGIPGATPQEAATIIPVDWEALFDSRLAAMREAAKPLGKLLNVPKNSTSFAGGYPDPEFFPSAEEAPHILHEALIAYPEAFQYGRAIGTDILREALIPYLQEQGTVVRSKDNIIITASSQIALMSLGELFLGSKGTKVAVPDPVYLGLIGAWSRFQPNYIRVKSDQYGMIPDSLDQAYQHGAVIGYGVPDFDNPTGVTIPEWRRDQLVWVAKKHGKPFISDAPYYWLRYKGEYQRSMQQLGEENILEVGSTSKTIAPGLRIGWVVAPREVIDALIAAKPDLCTGGVSQAFAAAFIQSGRIWPHIERIKASYSKKHDIMYQEIQDSFPKSWTVADTDGGMFLSPIGPERTDTGVIFDRAAAQGVAILAGDAFCTDKSSSFAKRGMRMNYTNPSPEKIVAGVRKLGEILYEIEETRDNEVRIFPTR